MAVVLCVYVFASVGTYAIALDSAARIVERKEIIARVVSFIK